MEVERFDAYHRLYGGVADLSRIGESFKAKVNVIQLPRMILHERRVRGVVQNRTWACVGRHGFDHITLHLLRAGDFVSGPPGAEHRLQPGEIAVLDTSLPHVSQFRTHADIVTVQLARVDVEEVLPDLTGIHGAVLSADACRLVAGLLSSLTQPSTPLPADPTGHIASATINLLGLAPKGVPASNRTLSTEAADTIRRRRAQAFIAAQLSNPKLDAETIAAGIGSSRSVLYRLFSVEGGVRRFIQQQRLNDLRRALSNSNEGRGIGKLVYDYGFNSDSHCNRAFAATFGLPPGQYRIELRRARTNDNMQAGVEDILLRSTRTLY
ncbi:helix-turn-helix domain-containing protein [Methylobacterium sp. J-092]|uniref:helix-turn-helix domain-containing protein n=1 Tax=Methylobacterium sp. J-092 TaxID=2836667 RepID=UPI001FB884DF|nr:helix-turn-helix domain-containing protein [Methylobacterium sp. J-092]MCJ2009858.1 helix-turn-helix domain-containing protein [Methylobacterium sp. J-092]